MRSADFSRSNVRVRGRANCDHFTGIVGEDPVFASYAPTIFLVNGAEGIARGTPAVTINALVNQKLTIRLIGMHAVNATFQVFDSTAIPTAQNFDLHNVDGWAQTPQTVPSIDIYPGQTKDVSYDAGGGDRLVSGNYLPAFTRRLGSC